jgi:predicted HTH transcriptional regulator
MNLHTNKNDDAITHACLKTIAAFLNTDGGLLLIGVADDGSIVGIERDGLQNADKFQRHLWNTLRQSLGEVSSINVNTEVLPVDDKSICLVECKPSAEPVICKSERRQRRVLHTDRAEHNSSDSERDVSIYFETLQPRRQRLAYAGN